MSKTSIPFIKFLVVLFLVTIAQAQVKADHLKGQNDFTQPSSCSATPCTISSGLNGWFACKVRAVDVVQVPFQIEQSLSLFGVADMGTWAYLTSPIDGTGIALYRHFSFPEAASFTIKVKIYNPPTEFSTTHAVSFSLYGSRTDSPLVADRTTRQLQSNNMVLAPSMILSAQTMFSTSAAFQHIFLFIYDGYSHPTGPRITDIQLLETCDADQTKITLTDGTERCADTASLTLSVNCDVSYQYKTGSYTDFECGKCDSTGTTPLIVTVGSYKGCAQQNMFNVPVYKATTVQVETGRYYLIPVSCQLQGGYVSCSQQTIKGCKLYYFDGTCKTCANGQRFDSTYKVCPNLPAIVNCQATVKSQGMYQCVSCKLGFILSLDHLTCFGKIDFCAFYTNGVCVNCISEYKLSGGICIKCPSGSEPVDGICFDNRQPIDTVCGANQYQNDKKVCVDGNITNCELYTSPSGQCQQCKTGFELNESNQCFFTCPPPTSTKRYLLNNGKCIEIDIQCILPNEDGFCAVCEDGFYQSKGICYKVIEVEQPPQTNLRS